MNLMAIGFTLLFLVLALRILILKGRAQSLSDPTFRALSPAAGLAFLKERLLLNPTKRSLENLILFAEELGIMAKALDYEPLRMEQIKLADCPDALELDNLLFEKEARWLDSITPPEIEEAQKAKSNKQTNEYIERSLKAVQRFYSDEKIEDTLSQLIPDFPKAEILLTEYRELKKAREASLADEESLKTLRSKRDVWDAHLEQERKNLLIL